MYTLDPGHADFFLHLGDVAVVQSGAARSLSLGFARALHARLAQRLLQRLGLGPPFVVLVLAPKPLELEQPLREVAAACQRGRDGRLEAEPLEMPRALPRQLLLGVEDYAAGLAE